MNRIVAELKEFVQANTPESALLAAELTVATGFFSGKVPAEPSVLAAAAALVIFGFAESTKDAAEAKPTA